MNIWLSWLSRFLDLFLDFLVLFHEFPCYLISLDCLPALALTAFILLFLCELYRHAIVLILGVDGRKHWFPVNRTLLKAHLSTMSLTFQESWILLLVWIIVINVLSLLRSFSYHWTIIMFISMEILPIALLDRVLIVLWAHCDELRK